MNKFAISLLLVTIGSSVASDQSEISGVTLGQAQAYLVEALRTKTNNRFTDSERTKLPKECGTLERARIQRAKEQEQDALNLVNGNTEIHKNNIKVAQSYFSTNINIQQGALSLGDWSANSAACEAIEAYRKTHQNK